MCQSPADFTGIPQAQQARQIAKYLRVFGISCGAPPRLWPDIKLGRKVRRYFTELQSADVRGSQRVLRWEGFLSALNSSRELAYSLEDETQAPRVSCLRICVQYLM